MPRILRGGKELLTMDQYEFVRTAHRNYGKNISGTRKGDRFIFGK
jgi:hypothetical protein